jgi:pimeloyl-ACP methyl ester carboxylesterase
MIAQTVAIEHPARVRSLTSIMSTTGDLSVGGATPEAWAVLTAPPARTRREAIERTLITYRVIGSPGYELDERWLAERTAESFERAHDPPGVARQLLAILASGDRTARLRHLEVPTLVIHGADDPLVDVSGGVATADAIAGSARMIIEGVGHDLPRPLWPTIIERLASFIRRSDDGGGDG